MISTASYAEKYGYSNKTVAAWCHNGKIEGVVKIPYKNSCKYAYLVPENAVPIRNKCGRPKTVREKPIPPPKPKRIYTPHEAAMYIRNHAHNRTYRQLMDELDMTMGQIRRIYDRLHDEYGI